MMILLRSLIILLSISTFAFTNPVLAKTSSMPMSGEAKPSMEPVEQSLISLMHQWRLPGASLAIVKDGHVVYARGFGWADISQKKPVQPYSLFRIASVSKLFTATTVLKLAQENKLSLDSRVFDILNDLKPINTRRPINPKIYDITVKDLLQMSSGWFAPGSGHFDPMFGPWPKSISFILPELPSSCELTARMMMTMKLRYKPGSQFVYSNLDYCMLGLVIDKVTGHPYGYAGYEEYVTSQILMPLGITNMFIGNTYSRERGPHEVVYYSPNAPPPSSEESINTPYLPYSNTQILQKNFSDGGWVATASDLARFMYALSHHQILTEKYLDIMHSKPNYLAGGKSDYFTMGMKVYNIGTEQYWIQTGSFTGTNAMVINRPDGTTIAVIFNTRPGTFTFFSKFRPQLRGLLLSSKMNTAIAGL